MTTIYLLRCPITSEIKYIGRTSNIKKRYYVHTNKKAQEKLKTPLAKWLTELLCNSIKPLIETIEICENWQERETYWISYYRELGSNLCNLADGGGGCKGYKKTEEQKRKHSESFMGKNTWMKGKKFNDRWKNNISKATTKGNSPASKKIIDINTNLIFDTVSDAAESLNMNRTTLVAMLTGQNPNKTNLRYL